MHLSKSLSQMLYENPLMVAAAPELLGAGEVLAGRAALGSLVRGVGADVALGAGADYVVDKMKKKKTDESLSDMLKDRARIIEGARTARLTQYAQTFKDTEAGRSMHAGAMQQLGAVGMQMGISGLGKIKDAVTGRKPSDDNDQLTTGYDISSNLRERAYGMYNHVCETAAEALTSPAAQAVGKEAIGRWGTIRDTAKKFWKDPKTKIARGAVISGGIGMAMSLAGTAAELKMRAKAAKAQEDEADRRQRQREMAQRGWSHPQQSTDQSPS